jgi:hypothetical protein
VALDALKETFIPLQSTALGEAAKKMVQNLQLSMGNLDADSLRDLAAIVQARQKHDNPNAL